MIINNCVQGSPEWFSARAGSVGASSVDKIVTTTGKSSTQRQAYLYQKAAEKLTGTIAETYSNANMATGVEREQESRELFAMIHDVEIEQVGLILPFEGAGYHCSPDGIVKGKNEGLELKNVLGSTQVKYLDKGEMPTEYKLQIQMSLLVTEWDVWNFFTYHPGLPPFDLRVGRDEKLIKAIKTELQLFSEDLDKLVNKLKGE